jgi:hypothetical protein
MPTDTAIESFRVPVVGQLLDLCYLPQSARWLAQYQGQIFGTNILRGDDVHMLAFDTPCLELSHDCFGMRNFG